MGYIGNRHIQPKRWQLFLFFFCIGGCCFYIARQIYWRYIWHHDANAPFVSFIPPDATVHLDSTNLPIVILNTKGRKLSKEQFIKARMIIIDNGENKLNYFDTINHQNQHFNYIGNTQLRFRGHSSYLVSPKKSFAVRPVDLNGNKIKVSLLGMRSDKKWALRAIHGDQTLMHDVLTNELAKPYFDYVPEMRHCEVVLDDIYLGVYLLSEQITYNRLGLKKPKKDGKNRGEYIFQIDRPFENRYISKYHPQTSDGKEIENYNTAFAFEGLSFDEMSEDQRQYICGRIDTMEDIMASPNFSIADGKLNEFVDFSSFINYQIATELAHNGDGYRASVFFYKQSDKIDPRFKLLLWDFDSGYGDGMGLDVYKVDRWQYTLNDVLVNSYLMDNPKELKCVPFWWYKLMNDNSYRKLLSNSWAQHRKENYSDEHIDAVIDSLEIILTATGAESRNASAWFTWGREPLKRTRVINTSYKKQLQYLRTWTKARLAFMDQELLGENKTCLLDSLYRQLGYLNFSKYGE